MDYKRQLPQIDEIRETAVENSASEPVIEVSNEEVQQLSATQENSQTAREDLIQNTQRMDK